MASTKLTVRDFADYDDNQEQDSTLIKFPVLEFLNNLWGPRNRVVIGLSYQPARLNSLAELIHWNRLLGSLNVKNSGFGLKQ